MNSYKQCPGCGRQFPVTDAFCENCGSRLTLIQPQPTIQQPTKFPVQTTTAYPEKKNTGALVGLSIAIVLILAAIVLLGLFLLKQYQEQENPSDPAEIAAVSTTVPDPANAVAEATETEPPAVETAPPAVETEPPQQQTIVSVVTVIQQVTVPQTDPPSVYAVPTPAPDPQPAGKTYQAFVDACTWADARQKCEAAGGHLAYITSDEDWNQAISVLSGTGLRYVWLGGSTTISADGALISASWLDGSNLDYINNARLWYPNEPSGWDNSDPAHPLEPYIMLWYVDNYWSLNDTSNDVLKYYKPERIGYLCEFD